MHSFESFGQNAGPFKSMLRRTLHQADFIVTARKEYEFEEKDLET